MTQSTFLGVTVDRNHVAYIINNAWHIAQATGPQGMKVTWRHNEQQRQLQTDQEFRETDQDLTEAVHAGCSHWNRRHIRPENQPPGRLPISTRNLHPAGKQQPALEPGPTGSGHPNVQLRRPGPRLAPNSSAKSCIDALKDLLLNQLPGYNTVWTVPEIIPAQEHLTAL